MASLQASDDHRRALAAITLRVLLGTRRLWSKLGAGDFDESWSSLSPSVLALISAGQLAAAREAAGYVAAAVDEQNIVADPVATLNPNSLAGVASSGVPLAALMVYPLIHTRAALAKGAPMAAAQKVGRDTLDGIVTMQVSDAGRAAESVETAVRPAITRYVRHLNLPSCSRCAILAGRVYRWSTGFQRHPRCDCGMTPVTESTAKDLVLDPLSAIKSGQVRLSQADYRAIVDDGADLGRVINAHRGMSTEQIGGQTIKVTTELGRQRLRLRPVTIYEQAGDDREFAIKLLRRHGYLL